MVNLIKKKREKRKRNCKQKLKFFFFFKDKAEPFFPWRRNLGCKSRLRYGKPPRELRLVTHFREGPARLLPAL